MSPLPLPGREPPTTNKKLGGKLDLFTSLRAELALSIAVLASVGLLIAVATGFGIEGILGLAAGRYLFSIILLVDVLIFVLFGMIKLNNLVLNPLDSLVEATERIADGNWSTRAPPGTNREFARLAKSINRMTVKILENEAQLSHLEKVATMGRLAAGVAHEIGTPLGAITGYADALRRRVNGNVEMAEAIGGIERESARIDRIMRGMLEYARPRRRTSLPVDVGAAVLSAVDNMRLQGKIRDVDLAVSVESDLPTLHGDRVEIEQIITNLVTNAVDALEGKGRVAVIAQRSPFTSVNSEASRRRSDGAEVKVAHEMSPRLRAWLNVVGEPNEIIKIVVADSGPGVPVSEVERIFDPFYSTRDSGRGTGLGLAIVARVVEGLGGAVWVRPAREGGAAFIVYLPVPVAAEQGLIASAQPALN